MNIAFLAHRTDNCRSVLGRLCAALANFSAQFALCLGRSDVNLTVVARASCRHAVDVAGIADKIVSKPVPMFYRNVCPNWNEIRTPFSHPPGRLIAGKRPC
jgi:hypothetical protein